MLEHQSSNDRYMALRMMTYVGLLYESLLNRKQLTSGEALPPVLPLVIYSGVPRWRAALDIADLITPTSSGLRLYQPQQRYVLLPRALPDTDLHATEDLMAIKEMLDDHSRSWIHQWKMEGMEEGKKEGQIDLLHKQLVRKFGPLPSSLEQRLQSARSDELEAWSLNLLEAATLSDVFTR